MIYILLFLFFNLIIGVFVVLLSKDIFPYREKENYDNMDFNSYEEINDDKTNLNESLNNDESLKNEKNENSVEELAKSMLPSELDHKSPEQEAIKEMDIKVKDYFKENPKDAAKIFKSMLRKDDLS
tara:strand:+ start:663 stop:1040 length:378 start_codon:yes stop_codon:yes gene_type:complete